MSGLSQEQMDAALQIAAWWLGPRMGYPGWAPTGRDAAHRAAGPMLIPDWDIPGEPTPAVILEGGPYEWAVEASLDPAVVAQLRQHGVHAEAWAGYAMTLYSVGPPVIIPCSRWEP